MSGLTQYWSVPGGPVLEGLLPRAMGCPARPSTGVFRADQSWKVVRRLQWGVRGTAVLGGFRKPIPGHFRSKVLELFHPELRGFVNPGPPDVGAGDDSEQGESVSSSRRPTRHHVTALDVFGPDLGPYSGRASNFLAKPGPGLELSGESSPRLDGRTICFPYRAKPRGKVWT